MFDLGNYVFVVYDMPELLVYAPTTQAAAEVVAQLKPYQRPQDQKPSFKLICVSGKPTQRTVGPAGTNRAPERTGVVAALRR
jgi:hypothetical protein